MSPIYVVGVFDYANEMEDPETMFHLFHETIGHNSESGLEHSLENYVPHWRKGFSFFEEAIRVEFTAANLMRINNSHYSTVSIRMTRTMNGPLAFY